MPSGAEPGTMRGRWRAPSPNAAPAGPARTARPRQLMSGSASSTAPAMRCGKPEDLTDRQTAKLAWIAKTDPRLYRAYLLKEGLRHVFSVKGEEGKQALDRWISWARRCRIPVFVELAGRIVRHRQAIDAALDHGLSAGADRIHQHQDQGVDPRRVRLPLRRSAHRPGDARPRRPPARTARTRLTPTMPSSANSAAPVSGSGRRIDAGTPAAALGQQQRAGQACPSALTSLKPPHPA